MTKESKSYWESYYSSHRDPVPPSLFAEFVCPFLRQGNRLLELGCGNGRDSVFFAEHHIRVNALDQCSQEIGYLNKKFAAIDHLEFVEGNMEAPPFSNKFDYIYSRFSLHSINADAETAVFDWSYDLLEKNGLFFIEVRSIHDALYGQGTEVGHHEFVTDHYRRFIELEEMIAKAANSGYNLLYSLESQGLAPYKTEDPMVIRLIFQK